MKHSKSALTLVELLLAITIFSIIATMLYSVLFQGISLWKRDTLLTTNLVEKRIVLEKIASDIRQSFIHQWVKFVGKADQIYFCKIDDGALSTIRYLVYHSRRSSKPLLIRESSSIIMPIHEDEIDASKPMSKLFDELSFAYGFWDAEEEKIVERNTWDDTDTLPQLILIHYKIDNHAYSYQVIHPLGVMPEPPETQEEE
ncbi:MAG: type II secretion system protein [Chlamydiota bacterium]|nr:type II secretion system protein [Chlamydiota bacterium]